MDDTFTFDTTDTRMVNALQDALIIELKRSGKTLNEFSITKYHSEDDPFGYLTKMSFKIDNRRILRIELDLEDVHDSELTKTIMTELIKSSPQDFI